MRDLREIYRLGRQTETGATNGAAYQDAKASVTRRERASLAQFKQETQKRLRKESNADAAQNKSADEAGKGKKRKPLILGVALAAAAAVVIAVCISAATPSAQVNPASSSPAPQTEASPEASAAASVDSEGEAEIVSATPEATAMETLSPEQIEELEAAAQEDPDDVETVVDSFHGYNVGDVVYYGGTVHYKTSESDELKGPCKAGEAMITAINPNGRHAFHLVHMSEDSTLYGWVDESFLSKP